MNADSALRELVEKCSELVNLVEGPFCKRWADDGNFRFKDTAEWVRFYNATKEAEKEASQPPARAPAAGEGLVVVPREPTEAMREAGMAERVKSPTNVNPYQVWTAMLAAAPAAQVAELEHCEKCGYMTRNGAKCGCAAPAVVVDEAKSAIDMTKLKATSWPEKQFGGLTFGMPSGIKLIYGDIEICVSSERSQHKNRDIAMRALAAALGQGKA